MSMKNSLLNEGYNSGLLYLQKVRSLYLRKKKLLDLSFVLVQLF